VAADETIHPAFQAWAKQQTRSAATLAADRASDDISDEFRPDRFRPERSKTEIESGETTEPVHLDPDSASRLIVAAARLAAGFFRPTQRSVVVWIEGDSELAVEIGGVRIDIGYGRVDLLLPVRCDQTGAADVVVTFAVGASQRPAGLYASTLRRPTGPKLIIDTWGDALVAFAWKTLLELASQLAGAIGGKDGRGNLLVPAELRASREGLTILPMGRFRFAGSSGLKSRTVT